MLIPGSLSKLGGVPLKPLLCFDGSAVKPKCPSLGSIAFLFLFLTVRSPEGDLTLYCKGADTILYELLDSSCESLKEETTEHLNVSVSFCMTPLHLIVSFYLGVETYFVLRQKTRHLKELLSTHFKITEWRGKLIYKALGLKSVA